MRNPTNGLKDTMTKTPGI